MQEIELDDELKFRRSSVMKRRGTFKDKNVEEYTWKCQNYDDCLSGADDKVIEFKIDERTLRKQSELVL